MTLAHSAVESNPERDHNPQWAIRKSGICKWLTSSQSLILKELASLVAPEGQKLRQFQLPFEAAYQSISALSDYTGIDARAYQGGTGAVDQAPNNQAIRLR